VGEKFITKMGEKSTTTLILQFVAEWKTCTIANTSVRAGSRNNHDPL
jgi:hypothetical protein